ncbi:MAG: histidine kinase [Bacteroidota bacterium]
MYLSPEIAWRRVAVGGGLLLAWSVPALVALSYYYLNQTVTAQPLDWRFGLISTLPNWYLWALFSPLVMVLARRVRPRGSGLSAWGPVLAAHLGLLSVLLLVHAGANLALFTGTGLHEEATASLYRVHLGVRLHSNVLAYIALAGAVYAVDYYRQNQERQRRAAQLEAQLAQAHLRALRMQLNPHFLFNALHAVGSLVRTGNAEASVQMIGRLGAFMRVALESNGQQEQPLEHELAFVRRYLEIEEIRFQGRLIVDLDIEPGLEQALVPSLLLQPLVENAIKHGVAPYARTGRVRIHAATDDDTLVLTVDDDGPGYLNGAVPQVGAGVGLANTRDRLHTLYGAQQSFTLTPQRPQGMRAQVRLPLTYIKPVRLPHADLQPVVLT